MHRISSFSVAIAVVAAAIFVGCADAGRRGTDFEGCPPLVMPNSEPPKLRVMPFGDSISICCHKCAVPVEVLPPKYRARAEKPQPFAGYIKPMWRILQAYFAADDKKAFVAKMEASEGASLSSGTAEVAQPVVEPDGDPLDDSTRAKLPFRFVGRVQTCMKNASLDPRLRTDDWEVRYEAYYGFTSKRINREVVLPAMNTQDPDIVMMHVGTNDMIQPKYNTVGWGRVGFAVPIVKQLIQNILGNGTRHGVKARPTPPQPPRSGTPPPTACPVVPPQERWSRRHLFISTIIPYWNEILGKDIGSPKRGSVDQYNTALLKAAVRLQLDYPLPGFEEEFAKLRDSYNEADEKDSSATATEARWKLLQERTHRSRLHVVNMNRGFSVVDDLHGDGLHPNLSGEWKLAKRYFMAMEPFLAQQEKYWPTLRGGDEGKEKPPVDVVQPPAEKAAKKEIPPPPPPPSPVKNQDSPEKPVGTLVVSTEGNTGGVDEWLLVLMFVVGLLTFVAARKYRC